MALKNGFFLAKPPRSEVCRAITPLIDVRKDVNTAVLAHSASVSQAGARGHTHAGRAACCKRPDDNLRHGPPSPQVRQGQTICSCYGQHVVLQYMCMYNSCTGDSATHSSARFQHFLLRNCLKPTQPHPKQFRSEKNVGNSGRPLKGTKVVRFDGCDIAL